MSSRRFFSESERVALYLAADGKCGECGVELDPGWHADHVKAHSRGGRTDVNNGQALCPECNLKKGATVAYRDSFNARPFQRDVIASILDGMASGRRVTTVLASPGSGKTLAYQAAATHLYREGLIDFVAIFVPRVTLAQQCELKWMYLSGAKAVEADCKLFDSAARIGRIRHVKNQLPLTPPGETGIGIVTTYSALVIQPEIYRSWARQHRGRFLLVADEAQFCGAANDERSGGTKAGVWMEELHEYSAHTLLLTGTPYRADDQPLILADYDQPGEDGLRQLLSHAEATYRTGIAEGYLRRFEAKMTQARVKEKVVDGTAIEYDLSVNSSRLREVLRQPNVWQPIADEVVTAVREKQRVHPRYRGLISCMEQGEARQVFEYLARRHPGLRVMLSVSEDGKAAEDALRQFKAQEADVLVTVRKAFIGYDCPEITVVGVLTNYRDQGHLMQLVGRGLRTWSEVEARSQSCRVICPDDEGMDRFVKFMRDESEQGLRERDRRDAERERSAKPRQEPLSFVETAFATTARAVSNDVEMDNEQLLLIEAVKRHNDLTDDVTKLMKFADDLGLRLAAAAPAPAVSDPATPLAVGETPETEQEQIDRIKGETAEWIRKYLSSQGIYGGDPRYSDCMKTATIWVNKRSSLRANQVRTLDQARRRLEAARALLDEAECLS